MTRTVLHISDSREFGGTEQTILQLLGGLDRRRWRPVLWHPRDMAASRLVDGARRVGVEQRPMDTAMGLRGLLSIPQLARQIRSLRPDVVHAHLTYPLSCKFLLAAAVLARVPAVVATSQLFVDLPRSRSVALQHAVVDSAVDRFLAVSEEVAANLRGRFGVPARKITLVRNAVAPEVFGASGERSLRDDWTGGCTMPVVLTVARLDEQKGHRFLLEAATMLPEVLFVLAGDGPLRPQLEADAAARGISDRVRFLGERSDVPALLGSCDLFVLPSVNEGLPLAILEAMAAGKPVIASSIGGIAEAIVDGQTGLLVPPGDVVALVSAIRAVVGSPTRAADFGAAGRRRAADEFSASAMVLRVADVYDELLA